MSNLIKKPSEDQVKRLPKALLHDHLDGGLRPQTIIDIAKEIGHTLPTYDAAELAEWFRSSCDSGSLVLYLETFAHTVAVMQRREDIVRVARVRALLPKAKLRLDVNGGWSVEQALINLYEIYEEVGPLEYVEQPCATLEELRQLKEKLAFEIKIAGDEVIRKAEDPFAINLQGAVDILMLKAAPLGGITRAREIGAHHKLPMVVSSALDSAVGISYGLQLAASLPSLDYACGLATGQLLSADIAALPLENGELAVHSVSPDADLLAKYAVPVERLTWWKERTKRAFYAGAESEIKARGWNW